MSFLQTGASFFSPLGCRLHVLLLVARSFIPCFSLYAKGKAYVLLGGNLPPFGSAAVLVEEQDCYLVVELPRRRVVFPGGFMTWREDPKHTAQREAQEETGLLVRVDHLIGTYFSASDSFLNMSTVSCVYAAEVIGGVLRNSAEGRACWLHEEELRKRLSPHSRGILDDYLRSRSLQRGIPASSDSQMPLPLAW